MIERIDLHEIYTLIGGKSNIAKVYDKEMPNTKKIAMEVKTIQSNGAFSFLEIDLITGRSHQIRAHLSHLGNPIIGDIKLPAIPVIHITKNIK